MKWAEDESYNYVLEREPAKLLSGTVSTSIGLPMGTSSARISRFLILEGSRLKAKGRCDEQAEAEDFPQAREFDEDVRSVVETVAGCCW